MEEQANWYLEVEFTKAGRKWLDCFHVRATNLSEAVQAMKEAYKRENGCEAPKYVLLASEKQGEA